MRGPVVIVMRPEKKVPVELIISPDIKEPDNVGVLQSGQKLSCQAIIASER